MNVSGGSLNITSQNFDIHGGGTGLRNIVHQPLPTSGAWTATIKANWDPTTNYNNAGLMVYGDDANFIKAGMVWSGGRKFEAFKELNNTATALGSATANMPATFPTTWYLRLTSNGTTIQPAYSRRRGDLDQLRRHDEPDRDHRAEDRRVRDLGERGQP